MSLKVNNWKPVTLENSILQAGIIDGLVGIEECQNYNIIKGSRRLKKRKRGHQEESAKAFKIAKVDDKKSNSKKKNKSKGKEGSTVCAKKEKVDSEDPEIQKLAEISAWQNLGLDDTILKAIQSLGFKYPTEIQAATLPASILGRRDILGAAETGSGKTLAFGLPILTGILRIKSCLSETSDKADKKNSPCTTNKEGVSDSEKSDSEKSNNEKTFSDSEESDCEGSNNKKTVSDSEESDCEFKDEIGNLQEDGTGCVKCINNIQLELQQPLKPLYALILTPTRELAIQVKDHLTAAAKYTGINIAVLVGGMAEVKQERILSKGPEIVVATPGRLWKLIQSGNSHLSQINDIRFLAIDETDRMLERGHFQELHDLLERINADEYKKKIRQNFVFSATLTLVHKLPNYLIRIKKIKNSKRIKEMTPSQKLQKIIDILGITNPKIVDITQNTAGTSTTLKEYRIICEHNEKDNYTYYFLKQHPGRTLIFCNSIGCVKRLASLLSILECRSFPLHASMQQKQRLKNLERFRDSKNGILIATDVAARGLDIPNVDYVLHYQTPRTSESYVHRSGRTARASKEGVSVVLIEPTELTNYLKLCKTLGKSKDIPNFPINDNYLTAVKERVMFARQVDKKQIGVRKASAEKAWLQKAAQEMDIILDDRNMPSACVHEPVGI